MSIVDSYVTKAITWTRMFVYSVVTANLTDAVEKLKWQNKEDKEDGCSIRIDFSKIDSTKFEWLILAILSWSLQIRWC